MKDPAKSVALVVAGLGFLYFGWLFATTGIYADPRGRAFTSAEDPDRFSYSVGVVVLAGAASVAAGLISMLRR